MAHSFLTTQFLKAAFHLKDCPQDGRPEIVLAGRSNVGKSSLINALCQRKRLAKVASTPGKTQSVVYFDVAGKCYLTDLPGYGFSSTGLAKRQAFSKLTDDYFHSDRPIALVLSLIDLRHEPTKQDAMMIRFLCETKRPFVICLTKADKLSRNEQFKNLQAFKRWRKEMNVPEDILEFVISSEKGQGIDALRQHLTERFLS